MRAAEAAVTILESDAPGTPALALALATVAQRRLQEGRDDDATLAWGRRALDLAERIGYEPAAVHALTTVAVTEIYLGQDVGWAHLEESRARAAASDLKEDVTRALVNLVETANDMRRHDIADAALSERSHTPRVRAAASPATHAGTTASWLSGVVDDDARREGQALLDRPDTANQVRQALTLGGSGRAGDGDRPLLDGALERRSMAPRSSARCAPRAPRPPGWPAVPAGRPARRSGPELARQASANSRLWWGAAFGPAEQGGRQPPGSGTNRTAGLRRTSRRGARPGGSSVAMRTTALADSNDVGHLRLPLDVQRARGESMARQVVDRLRSMGEHRIPGARERPLPKSCLLTAREVELLGSDHGLTNVRSPSGSSCPSRPSITASHRCCASSRSTTV
jgi:hypothetical protein